MRKRTLFGEDGQSAVEAALTFSVFAAVLFGAMQVGFGLYAFNYTAEAARMATRYAMVRGSACTSFGSACPAAASDIQNYVKNLGFPGIDTSKVTVTPTWPTTGSACTPSLTPCNNPGNLVQVKVQYTITLPVPFAHSLGINIYSTSKVVISQ